MRKADREYIKAITFSNSEYFVLRILFQKSQTFETGESDHHHMIYTMMKATFVKLPPKKLIYRCYKSFDEHKFLHDLDRGLADVPAGNYKLFEEVHENILNIHVIGNLRIGRKLHFSQFLQIKSSLCPSDAVFSGKI